MRADARARAAPSTAVTPTASPAAARPQPPPHPPRPSPGKAVAAARRGAPLRTRLLGLAALFAAALLIGVLAARGAPPPPPACPDAGAAPPAPSAPLGARPVPGASGAYAVGYAPADAPLDRLAVFLASWREHSPATRVALLLPPSRLADPATAALLAELGAEGVPFEAPPERDDDEDEEEPRKPGRARAHALAEAFRYLARAGPAARAAALCLAADETALQGDPWADGVVEYALRAGKVLFTAEAGPRAGALAVRDSAAVAGAVNACFGSGELAKIAGAALLSPDFVIGPAAGVLEHARLATDILATRVRHRCLKAERADAAALAYALHDFGADPRMLDFKFSIKESGRGAPALTAAIAFPAKLDAAGRLRPGTRKAGPAAPVVVGYGAHPALVQHYLRRYGRREGVTDLDLAQRGEYSAKALGSAGEGLPEAWADESASLFRAVAAAEERRRAWRAGAGAGEDEGGADQEDGAEAGGGAEAGAEAEAAAEAGAGARRA